LYFRSGCKNKKNHFIFASGKNDHMRSDCPLNFGLELFGDRWTLLIIRDLMFFNKRFFNEFLSSAEGISTSILADRLELLEKGGMISKGRVEEHKQKIAYRLTEKAIDLLPIILEIGLWSERYAADQLTPHRELILGGIRKNKTVGIKQMKQKLYKEHVSKGVLKRPLRSDR
jgi:DNA-binding HxlR family transcriptional regulator